MLKACTGSFIDNFFGTDQRHFNAFELGGKFFVEGETIVLRDALMVDRR